MQSFCPARHCILGGVLEHFPALEQSSAEKDRCHAFVMPSAFCVARILHLQLLIFTGCEEEPCPCSSSCKCCWVPSASWRLELPSRISHWGAVRFVWRQSPGKLLLCSSDLLAGAVPSCSWGAWVCVLGNYAQSSAGKRHLLGNCVAARCDMVPKQKIWPSSFFKNQMGRILEFSFCCFATHIRKSWSFIPSLRSFQLHFKHARPKIASIHRSLRCWQPFRPQHVFLSISHFHWRFHQCLSFAFVACFSHPFTVFFTFPCSRVLLRIFGRRLTRGCTRLFCQAWADYSSFSNFVPWPCRFSVRYRATSSTCFGSRLQRSQLSPASSFEISTGSNLIPFPLLMILEAKIAMKLAAK